MITLAQLRMLEAVARRGSFSRAAEALGVSQPSVSTQIRALEARYRVRLIARNGHDIRPSAAAEALMPKIRALLALAEEVEAALRAERELLTGALRVGYSTHQFVMAALSRFMAAHPGVRLEARSMASFDLLEMLRRGALEAAFCTLPAPEPDLDCLEICDEEIVLMVPAGHALAAAGAADWPTVARTPLIRREPASGTRRVFDAAAAAAGVAPITALDLGSWESMRAAVIAGIGVGVAMRGEIGVDPAVAAVRVADGLTVRHYLAATPEMRAVATVAALFDAAAGLEAAGP
ncbi:MAG: LysR family transcriptional regulator [Rhodobacteraceae bacterium]|nr:MAG: LysR family transcriptional regulator [Paracoccaceae bacterium]